LLDELQLGKTWTRRPVTITADAVVAFGKEYDPQSPRPVFGGSERNISAARF
jgi:hypothetical protein